MCLCHMLLYFENYLNYNGNNYSKYTANFVNNYAHINASPENNNNVKKSQMRQKHIKVCEFLYTEVH